MKNFITEYNATGLTIIGYTGSKKNIIIPDEINGKPVKHIGDRAFALNDLTSVVIGKNVTHIRSRAFALNNLTSIIVGKNVTHIGDRAFALNDLTSVVIGENVIRIGYGAFCDNQEIKTIEYKGEVLNVKSIDGYTMIIDSTKKKGDFTIFKCRYFGGKFEPCYVAQKGEFFAHGKTIKKAIEDVNFKELQKNLNVDGLVAEIKAKKTISVPEYRLLTGACFLGCKNFLQQNKLKETEFPLKKVLKITKNQYGGNRIQELFN